MDEKHLRKATEISRLLSCLSQPLRLMIICMLLKREMYVHEIIDELGTTKGNISQHLRVLSDRGLIESRRTGSRIFYRIADPGIARFIDSLKSIYCPDFDI